MARPNTNQRTNRRQRLVKSPRPARAPRPAAKVRTNLVRTADPKGRLNLGQQFANTTFIVRPGQDETEIILTIGSVIPQRELWLHKNPKALASVTRGLRQAAAGQFSPRPPNLDDDRKITDDIED